MLIIIIMYNNTYTPFLSFLLHQLSLKRGLHLLPKTMHAITLCNQAFGPVPLIILYNQKSSRTPWLPSPQVFAHSLDDPFFNLYFSSRILSWHASLSLQRPLGSRLSPLLCSTSHCRHSLRSVFGHFLSLTYVLSLLTVSSTL